MKVLLARNIDALGKVGDVVDVKRGFARNYLMPLGFAHEVTADNLSRIKLERKRLEAEEGKRLSSLKVEAGAVFAVAFSADGNVLAIGGFDGTIRFMDAVTGKIIKQFMSVPLSL